MYYTASYTPYYNVLYTYYIHITVDANITANRGTKIINSRRMKLLLAVFLLACVLGDESAKYYQPLDALKSQLDLLSPHERIYSLILEYHPTNSQVLSAAQLLASIDQMSTTYKATKALRLNDLTLPAFAKNMCEQKEKNIQNEIALQSTSLVQSLNDACKSKLDITAMLQKIKLEGVPCLVSNSSNGNAVDNSAVNSNGNVVNSGVGAVNGNGNVVNNGVGGVNNPTNPINNPINGVNNPVNPITNPINGVNNPTNPIINPTDGVNNPINPINNSNNEIANPTNGINDTLLKQMKEQEEEEALLMKSASSQIATQLPPPTAVVDQVALQQSTAPIYKPSLQAKVLMSQSLTTNSANIISVCSLVLLLISY